MFAVRAVFVLLFVALAWPAHAETYRDAQGRFSFSVPAGWQAAPLGAEGATASDGNAAYLSVVVVQGGSADTSRITAVINQIGQQWQSFKQGENGVATIAGKNGFYVFFDGVNPRGVASTLRIAGAAFGADEYVLVMAAPAAGFGEAARAFKLIEHSFAVAADAPAPAGAAPAGPASATPLPQRAVPEGLQAIDEPGGGRIVYGTLGAPSSGQATFRAGIHRLRGYFDAPPDLRNGVDGNGGNVSLVLFTAKLQGRAVVGLAVATSDPASGSRIGFLIDAPDRFAHTLGPMQQDLRRLTLAAAERARPASAGAPAGAVDLARIKEAARSVPLTDVQSPDGTLTVGVARGYQLQRLAMGSFGATGADGAVVNGGGGIPLLDPSGTTYQSWKRLLAMTPNFHTSYPGLVIPFTRDPVDGWVAARVMSAQQQHQPDPQIRLARKAMLDLPPGPVPMHGALIQGSEVMNGTPMVFLGSVIASEPSAEGSWTITVNLLHAPVEHADADLPAMWAMLTSVHIDQARLAATTMAVIRAMAEQSSALMQDRHDANMALMQSNFEHAMAQARRSQDAIDRSAAATIRYVGDSTVMRYEPTGEHVEVSSSWASDLARDDPQNFSVVPLSQYVKGVDY